MMAYLLDRISESLAKEGLTPRTNKARAWLRSKVKDLSVTVTVMELVKGVLECVQRVKGGM